MFNKDRKIGSIDEEQVSLKKILICQPHSGLVVKRGAAKKGVPPLKSALLFREA